MLDRSGFVRVCRADAICSVAAAAAELASMTEWGISLGPVSTPQAYIPSTDVDTGLKAPGFDKI